MMRRSRLRRARVAAVLVAAMLLTVTGLLGAPGAIVKLTSPKAGARVSGEVQIAASVRASAKVSYVIFGVDGDRPYSTNSSPYHFTLDTTVLPDGAHRVFAEAYDDFGMIGSSKPIVIVVRNSAAPAVARETASTRQASKPVAPRAPTLAPATSVMAHPAAFPGPRTVASAEEVAGRGLPAPTALTGGPAPEPTRIAEVGSSPLAQPMEPVATGHRGSMAAVVSMAPAAPPAGETAARAHTIVLNGRVVAFDVSPVIRDGRLQAGFRALFSESGARVTWVAEKRTARSVSPSLTVEVPVGSRTATVNGATVDMGAPALITQGRTMIPVRFFSVATGLALYYDSKTRLVAVGAPPRAMARSGAPG